MASFGSFETVRETYPDSSFTVYSAKRSGDPAMEYSIKVFSLFPGGLSGEATDQFAPLLSDPERSSIERIAVQRQAAQSSKFIAPVLESGQDDRGIWYATRSYPRSVDKIISGRVALNRDAVEHIIAAIAQGALDMERACGRPHGDIQPSNVHISGSEKLVEAEVVLSEPLPGNQADAVPYELSDLNAIGRILLQLVLQREIHRNEMLILPILPSREWTRLFGKCADAWLSLCNRLLDSNLTLEKLNLDQLLHELEQLRPKRSLTGKGIFTLAAAAVVLSAVAMLVAIYFKPRPPAPLVEERVPPPPTNELRLQPVVASAPAGDGTVEFTSQPDGARIMEGTNPFGAAPVRKRLSPGTHTITAQFENWPELVTNIQVATADNSSVNFRWPHGWVAIDLKPDDAEVFINDRSLGRARRKAMPPGDYPVRVEHPAYEFYAARITVGAGKTTPLPITLKALPVVVEFTTDPPGGAIFETQAPEKELGRTEPGQPLKLRFPPGSYSFFARHDGLDPTAAKQVAVSVGTNISLALPFKYGTAQFDTEPPGAAVFIAGKEVGKTPHRHRQKPGPINYRLEMTDYTVEQGSLEVGLGATVPLSVRLRPKEVGIVLRSDPPGAQFYLADAPLRGTNDRYVLTWGVHFITARHTGLPGLPGLEPQTASVQVDKSGAGAKEFKFSYATLEITNAESGARLLYQNKPIANLPARLHLKPDWQYDFVIEHGRGNRTDLPIRLGAAQSFSPVINLRERRATYTNSINMVLVRVSENLYAGKLEVTEQQYRGVMGGSIQGGPSQPVVRVNWLNALKFCENLSVSDQEFLARHNLAGWKYSLPTEAEWTGFANAAVSISDLSGNVAEWCLGSDRQPRALGGNVTATQTARQSPPPQAIPTRGAGARVQTSRPKEDAPPPGAAGAVSPEAIGNGSPVIGIRCVLRPPL